MTFTYLAKVTLSLTVALQATSGGGRTRVTTVPQNGGLAHTVTTDRGGVYRLEALPDDTYRVDFELRGFDIVRRNHVTVVAGAPARADVLLHVRPVCDGADLKDDGGAPWSSDLLTSARRHCRKSSCGTWAAFARSSYPTRRAEPGNAARSPC